MSLQNKFFTGGSILKAVVFAGAAVGCLAVTGEVPLGEFPLGGNGDALVRHVIEHRGEPLRDIVTEHTLYASDFGAVSDDGQDDLPALRALFAKAVEQGGTRVVIEPGVYNLLSAQDDTNAFDLKGGEDIVIDGSGAELLNGNPKSGFFGITGCKRMILRGFTADYNPPPFTQGKIVGVNRAERSFDFEVNEGFPLSDLSFFEGRNQIFGFLMDSRPEFRGRLKPDAKHAIRIQLPIQQAHPTGINEKQTVTAEKAVEVLGPRTVRLRTTDNRINSFEIGDFYVQLARSGTTQWVLYNNCEDLTFENLTIHASGAAVFIGSVCERVNILNCKVIPRGDRLISANGGGAIAQSHSKGIWVEGCRFESISDDPVNFYSKPIAPLAVAPGGGFYLFGAPPDRLAVGDELALFDSSEGKTIFRTKVATLNKNIATFDPPVDSALADLCGNPKERNWNVLKMHDYFMNLRLQSDYYVVRSNEFINCRGRLLLRASRGVVEGNRVVGSAMGGLVLANDWVCPEGYRICDSVIRNNHFAEFGYTADGSPASDIKLIRVPRDGDPFDAPGAGREHENILIANNTFANWYREPGLGIHGVKGLRLTGNRFIKDPKHPYFQGTPDTVIHIENSEDVVLSGNQNETPAKEFVQVDKGSDRISVGK
jgi:hypothetical protein